MRCNLRQYSFNNKNIMEIKGNKGSPNFLAKQQVKSFPRLSSHKDLSANRTYSTSEVKAD